MGGRRALLMPLQTGFARSASRWCNPVRYLLPRQSDPRVDVLPTRRGWSNANWSRLTCSRCSNRLSANLVAARGKDGRPASSTSTSYCGAAGCGLTRPYKYRIPLGTNGILCSNPWPRLSLTGAIRSADGRSGSYWRDTSGQPQKRMIDQCSRFA